MAHACVGGLGPRQQGHRRRSGGEGGRDGARSARRRGRADDRYRRAVTRRAAQAGGNRSDYETCEGARAEQWRLRGRRACMAGGGAAWRGATTTTATRARRATDEGGAAVPRTDGAARWTTRRTRYDSLLVRRRRAARQRHLRRRAVHVKLGRQVGTPAGRERVQRRQGQGVTGTAAARRAVSRAGERQTRGRRMTTRSGRDQSARALRV